MINNGLSTQFCKLFVDENTIVELNIYIQKYNQLIFSSSYFVGDKQAMLLIFKNISEKQFSKTRNEITAYINKNINQTIANNENIGLYGKLVLTKNEFYANSLKSIYYPLQETNIDFIIDWIYQYD
jgi:hypothetical protein